QQQPPCQHHHGLLQHKKPGRQREARHGMLGIQPRANRRRQITHHRFRNTVESQRHGRPAQAVLQQSNGRAEKQTRGRISPAQAEINRNEQRQVQKIQSAHIHRKRRLQHQRQDGHSRDRARKKLVHLNVRVAAAQFKCVVHGFTAAGGAVAGVSAGTFVPGALCASASFWNSTGSCVNSTNTSSSRSSFAAGFTRICLNGLPVFTSTTVPTGTSRGKILSMPLVTIFSPTFTVSSVGTYFIVSIGSPVPPTGL